MIGRVIQFIQARRFTRVTRVMSGFMILLPEVASGSRLVLMPRTGRFIADTERLILFDILVTRKYAS